MFRKDLEMKLLQNLKKDKKGFTLIEMIVVIVIIGILLAILVPGMFKYIDKAKDKQIEIDARSAYLEIETAIGEIYKNRDVSLADVNAFFTTNSTLAGPSKLIIKDHEVEFTIPDNGIVEEVNIDTNTGAILKMKYTWNGTKYVEMTGGIWGDVKKIGE